jgi:predicted dehydrogenase
MKSIAVIGFGFMGITHALNILKNPDLKLKAIVDIDPDLIEKNLKPGIGNISTGSIDPTELAGIGKYSSLDDCLLSEDLDTVNICTHVNLHYEMTKTALLNDRHVFVEKPFCLDISQAEELVNLAAERNRILMVGHWECHLRLNALTFPANILVMIMSVQCGVIKTVVFM